MNDTTFLARNGVPTMIDNAIVTLCASRPTDIPGFFIQYFQDLQRQGGRSAVKKDTSGIDWSLIAQQLPSDRSVASKTLRQELFASWDRNGNGYLSQAEVEGGLNGRFKDVFHSSVVTRAFNTAKGVAKSKSGSTVGDSYVSAAEFRLLMLYLRDYLELFAMFNRVDNDDDGRVSAEEFMKALPVLEAWGVQVTNPAETYKQLDADGGGKVLFKEFADWAIKKELNMVVGDTTEEPSPAKTSRPKKATASGGGGPSTVMGTHGVIVIDWAEMANKMPTDRSVISKKRRMDMFADFDPNGNGFLSVNEVEKGIKGVLKVEELFECKPVILRAHAAAKGLRKGKHPLGNDYVERGEFRKLLCYLRSYFEAYVMFDRVDPSDDRRITEDEFTQAVPMLQTWGVQIPDPAKTFREIDTNGGGKVLFDEFADWAIKLQLDLEDDIDEGEGVPVLSTPPPPVPVLSRAPAPGMPPVDWSVWERQLPSEKGNPDALVKRKELFDLMDVNKSRALSLFEVESGVAKHLNLPELAKNDDVFKRAFHTARVLGSKTGPKSNYVEFAEFRAMLEYMRLYFQMSVWFGRVDETMLKVNLEEFKKVVPSLRAGGLTVGNPETTFKALDKEGKGEINFSDVSDWVINQTMIADAQKAGN